MTRWAGSALQAAYIDNPRAGVTGAHIGWVHIWRRGERARLDPVPPGITDEAVLSRRYFEEAVRLDPGDARYRGFYAATLLAEGEIHQDEKLRRRGYYTMLDAVAAFPEFNYFTAGYVFSSRPDDSHRFKAGRDDQRRNLAV